VIFLLGVTVGVMATLVLLVVWVWIDARSGKV
jgi:hypothetical protein